MTRVADIRHDFDETGSVNSLLSLWGFVDDEIFLTKAGHVGIAYRMLGVDYECLDHAQRRDVVHRFEAALRVLDEHCRVYQYLSKRRIEPIEPPTCRHPIVQEALSRRADFLNGRRHDLYEVDLNLVLMFEGLRLRWHTTTRLSGILRSPGKALREWLSPPSVFRLVEADLDDALAHLRQRATAFEAQLADTARLTRLAKGDAFRFFRRLLNYDRTLAESASLKYDTHLDYFVADSGIECHRSHLQVGDAAVKVLTMKEPPASTIPHLLEQLYTVPGEFIACLEWRRIATDRMRRDIHARRRHFFNKRVSLVNYLSSETHPDEMLIDDSAGATVKQLGDALTEMEVHGHFFGECALTVALFDTDRPLIEHAAADAMKVLATHDGTLVAETYNLLNAWLGIVPGNSARNLRRLALLETNCADLSFLFRLDSGDRLAPPLLGGPALAIFETRQHTPYYFNLHVDDVAHTVAFGATGTGKSFLVNGLVLHAQQYEPLTVIFDLGHSYRKLAELLQGSYLEIGLHTGGVTINPFALEPSSENLHFLHAFACVLLEGADGYRLSDVEDRELYEAIENVYVLDATQRRLFTLANLLPRALATRLSTWVDGGRYADLFDHVEDTVSLSSVQVFEFEAMRAYPRLLEPLLFYVLHRVSARIADPEAASRFKLCAIDEAWRFIQHPRLRAYIEQALKTWRKRNAAMLLATQTIDDFASADLLRTVVESCPTKLLLPNPALERARYADLFQLNETELDLLTDLMPRQQFLLKRPSLAKVLTFTVDPQSYWLYTNTPADNERLGAVVREHGLAAGLDQLSASA